jgi:hypothetical protein
MRKFFKKENISLGIIFLISFIIAATPLLVYIGYHTQDYFIRESSLTKEFFEKYQKDGYEGIKPYVDYMNEVFVKDFSFRRQFVPGFPVIPLPYYLIIIPGLIAAVLMKRYEIFFISTIPAAGSFIAGCYDFRVLISAPAWIIAMSAYLYYCFGDLVKKEKNTIAPLNKPENMKGNKSGRFTKGIRYCAAAASVAIIIWGLIPAISYINKVSKDSNYLYLLPHKDVAVSRVVQDIVLGAEQPSAEMKTDELNRKSDLSQVPYDTLVSPQGAYAIMHLFLQNYDDKKILAFNNQTIQAILSPEEVLKNNIEAIKNYTAASKDLKLVWEVSDKSQKAIDFFSKFKGYGTDETVTRSCDGVSFSLYIMTIKNENIEKLKNDLQLLDF